MNCVWTCLDLLATAPFTHFVSSWMNSPITSHFSRIKGDAVLRQRSKLVLKLLRRCGAMSALGCRWRAWRKGGGPKIRRPQDGWFIGENPMKIRMIWGSPYLRKPPCLIAIGCNLGTTYDEHGDCVVWWAHIGYEANLDLASFGEEVCCHGPWQKLEPTGSLVCGKPYLFN